jgi:putative endonuclease
MVGRRRPLNTLAGRRGAEAEARAESLLRASGLRILDRNASSRFGELDIVALDGADLVVVEVRARALGGFGGAAASVGLHKQGRVLRAAQRWLASHPEHQQRVVRFDVVSFDGTAPPQWIRGAFGQDGWT